MIPTTDRLAFTEDHEMFRDQVKRFLEREAIPHLDRWEAQGIVEDRKSVV